jgi:signal transduction histidine kinase
MGDKNTILIIDDEVQNIKALTHILNGEYDVFAEIDSRRAVKTAEELMPDIIMLDVIMPEVDGYQVIKALKGYEKTRDIPVVFVTGLDAVEDEERGLVLGAVDYISKPFNSAVVRLRIKNQINLVKRSELVAAKEHAEHLSRVKSEFLARMSHEMLTPMTAIMGMTQLAKIQKADDCLIQIESSAKQLLELIHGVLDISDMEHGLLKLENAEFSFSEMLREPLKTAQINSAKKQQVFKYDICEQIPDMLFGDANRLKQIISNLLMNAVKFTPEQGEISFNVLLTAASEEENSVALQFEVSDSGIGVSAKEKKQIFILFEQADGSMNRKHGGIGIGLPLSKRLAQLMGGEMWVESEPGNGAKFIFTCKLGYTIL